MGDSCLGLMLSGYCKIKLEAEVTWFVEHVKQLREGHGLHVVVRTEGRCRKAKKSLDVR